MTSAIDTLENKLISLKASLDKMIEDVDNVHSIRHIQDAIYEHKEAIQILKREL